MKKGFPISSINATVLIFAIFAFCVSIFSSQIYAQDGSENAQMFRKNCERLHQAYSSGSILEGEYWFTTEEEERAPFFDGVIAYCNFCDEDAGDITFDGHVMKVTPNPKIVNSAFLRLYCISKVARHCLP